MHSNPVPALHRKDGNTIWGYIRYLIPVHLGFLLLTIFKEKYILQNVHLRHPKVKINVVNSNLIVRHEAYFLPIEDPRPLMFFIIFFRCLHFYRDSVQTKDFFNTFFPFLNQ